MPEAAIPRTLATLNKAAGDLHDLLHTVKFVRDVEAGNRLPALPTDATDDQVQQIRDLIVTTDQVGRLRQRLADLEDTLKRVVGGVLRERRLFVVDGWGVFEPKFYTPDNKYEDKERMVAAVVRRALNARQLNPSTGDVEPPEDAIVRAVTECLSISRPLKKGMRSKAYGLDPDQFVTEDRSGHGHWTGILRPND